ncbi:PilZ domain-containing protein [Novosphingobium resinovorum]|uniref:PilZ domain-containing protein n=1 Tax=Novosphingobium resinovorum TaxID=158500 RepID=UPI002ECFBB6C
MNARASLSVTEMRGTVRRPIDYTATGEHRQLGELELHVANISPHGCMIRGGPDLERGERLTFRLPIVGQIEGHLVWSHGDRAGFQFERLIRADDFAKLVAKLQPNRRLRGGARAS